MRILTDTSRGTISISTGKDMWELFALVPIEGHDGHFTITAFEANLLIFGVGPATVEAIRASLAMPAAAVDGAPGM